MEGVVLSYNNARMSSQFVFSGLCKHFNRHSREATVRLGWNLLFVSSCGRGALFAPSLSRMTSAGFILFDHPLALAHFFSSLTSGFGQSSQCLPSFELSFLLLLFFFCFGSSPRCKNVKEDARPPCGNSFKPQIGFRTLQDRRSVIKKQGLKRSPISDWNFHLPGITLPPPDNIPLLPIPTQAHTPA